MKVALERLEEVFVWGDRARPAPEVQRVGYEDILGGESLSLGGCHDGRLVRHTDRIVTVTTGTSVLHPSVYWAHPTERRHRALSICCCSGPASAGTYPLTLADCPRHRTHWDT